jgi:hypothetical protein
MKLNGITLLLLFAILNLGFTTDYKRKIDKCFVSFKSSPDLVAGTSIKLPKTAEPFRYLPTKDGKKFVSVNTGYRILYNNNKGGAFVNMKVERCDDFSYEKDKQNLLDHFDWLVSQSVHMEADKVTESDFNGYKVYGFSRNSIESGMFLGTYVLFAEPNLMVYFYFNNLEKEYRNFESIEDYRVQRDAFIDSYTSHLNSCLE